ncbi:MAG: NADH-quinone oxidoreductase subunit L [Bacteroidia bacterium]|nr:NADH-quinone oxidoreductase subunit L [Bacteroidia bacterium]
MVSLNTLIVFLPLAGAAINGLAGLLWPAYRKQETLIGLIATASIAVPFALLLSAFFGYQGEAIRFSAFSWIAAGNLQIEFSYLLDPLSLLMGLIVTGVGSLIHVYSIGYMHGDSGYYKYFAYLNLFIFAMNNLILGDNLLVMFLGWEGVGLCSYLLIGFWYQDMEKAGAAQKAFIANRIGDFAMLLAIFLAYFTFGTLDFAEIQSQIRGAGEAGALTEMFGDRLFWLTLLVFIAATGKSAQIPLFVWLPDAMAGPTPVSALIHAATMVTAGVYLIARMHDAYLASPEVMLIVVVVAALTAIIAALTAIAQNDIKKVLAYSTVSQLGFMFMALGAGAFTTAIFHVLTHAFFKACLFLGSGSVIHAMEHGHAAEDPQDIRTMGGLGKHMFSTRTTFWISTLAIAGVPGLAGFFSKDEILASLFFNGFGQPLYFAVWAVGLVTAVLTAFYMTRLSYLVFNGKERFKSSAHIEESKPVMTVPLWILAVLAIAGGYIGLPYLIGHGEYHWLNHVWFSGTIINRPLEEVMHEHAAFEYVLLALAFAVSIGTMWFTYTFYRKHDLAGDAKVQGFFGRLYETMRQKFYFDEAYDALIVRPFSWIGTRVLAVFDRQVVDGVVEGTAAAVSGIGEVFRRLQSGLVTNYVMILAAGVVLVLAYLVWG